MIVSSISKKRNHLHEICFSDDSSILIDTKTATQHGIFVGMELSGSDIAELKKSSERTRALSRGVWHIERADITKKALTDKLKRAGFPDHAVLYAVDRLLQLGLINDSAYAERLAEKLIEGNISKQQALYKMVAKGFDRSLAEEALAKVEHDPTAQINAIIEKKYKAKLSDPNELRKVVAALMRRGFRYSDIRSCLKQHSEELEYSEE